jgi:hypothetical protein
MMSWTSTPFLVLSCTALDEKCSDIYATRKIGIQPKALFMFMRRNEDELDEYPTARRTSELLNSVSTWKPASTKSAQALAVDTMGCMNEHFGYLL